MMVKYLGKNLDYFLMCRTQSNMDQRAVAFF